MVGSSLHCAVLPGGDPLVRERLARDLHDALTGQAALRSGQITVSYAPRDDHMTGAKGGALDLTQLVVAGAVSVPLLVKQITSVVQAWCQKDSRRTVTITDGDRKIEITGSPTRSQRELAESFFDSRIADTDDEHLS